MLALVDLRMDYALPSGSVQALKGVSIDVAEGEFFTLLGPSGCGKTTALRSIAGLERPTGGAIRIDNKPVFSAADGINVPPNRRDISMVFQSYAIWPHMTVEQNVAFPLETTPLSRSERAEKVRRTLELVGLAGYADRPAPLLSGGQQQRVALARALVKNAKVMLLDEPLSNLDAKLREQMRIELRDLQRRVRTTTVYVTHDQDEALSMSDRIALMRDGQVIETGTPEDLYLRPRKRFTAEFLGRTIVLSGTPAGTRSGGYALDTSIGTVVAAIGADLGDRVRSVMFRPDHVLLREDQLVGETHAAGENIWRGKIASRQFAGQLVDYKVTINATEISVRTTSLSLVPVGAEVTVSIPSERCVLLDE